MITGKDFYLIVSALVPLYFAMFLGYGSVKWWKIFTPDQCAGINRFVAVFAVPLLSFSFMYTNNLYKMNFLFIAADSLQKVVILVILFLWQAITRRGLDWTITVFSLAALPNTLVVGIPLMTAMYGDSSATLMVQIVVLQVVIWYTLLLFLFEYRGGRKLVAEQFPDTAAAISSFKVDSDVVSLSGQDPLEVESEIGEDGKLHVVLRSSSIRSYGHGRGPRVSTLSGVEVFSVQSSIEQMDRSSSFNNIDLHTALANYTNKISSSSKHHRYPTHSSLQGLQEEDVNVNGLQPSRSFQQRPADCELEESGIIDKRNAQVFPISYPPPNPVFSGSASAGGGSRTNQDLHMFVWSSSMSSSISDHRHMQRQGVNGRSATSTDFGAFDSSNIAHQHVDNNDPADLEVEGQGLRNTQMPPATVMTKLILIMVWRKLIRNPNTYASLVGLVWALIAFRWNIKMPLILTGCIKILSNTGLGMAMFSLGGPLVMAATSAAIGIRGDLLRVAIVQAALPLGIVPFVFAKEYDLHANVLSTGVIFGMFISLPVTIIYYVLLEL
ncbi:hypothetical protein Tsubulata_034577 [Turnera subulata]|uniref:Auxin efflux carrier component n=1 Tax=Turnera subulata TaxID=218843 RepID=A0A9Q0J5Y6_9ROSI|nr:hypothetical protein Tsubulata_034577 [Turnera subulata]